MMTRGREIIAKVVCNRNGALAIICVATLAVYLPTFFNGFMTSWDDQWQVENVFTARGFEWDNLKYVFTQPYMRQYSPLNQCVYMLLYAIGGYNAALFHGASLIAHIGNSLLIYIVLRRILRDTTKWGAGRRAFISFATALMFAVNPVQVESVAWVSASKIVFCTFFYLLATLCFMDFLSGKGRKFYALSLAMFVLSYGFKEHVAVFPLWATLLCAIYGADFKSRRTYAALLPLYATGLAMGLAYIFLINSYPELQTDNYEWWQRAVFFCYSLVEYVCKWIVPFRLQYLYIFPSGTGSPVPWWMLAYPLLLAVAVAAFRRQIARKPVACGVAFFLIHLILVLHIIPLNRPTIVADRYNYLSGAGLSFIMAYAAVGCRMACGEKAWRAARLALTLLVAYYSCMTFLRVQHWKTTETIKEDVMQQNHNNIETTNNQTLRK